MKISNMSVSVLGVPLDPPVRASKFDIATAYLVVVCLETDEGASGLGYGAVLKDMYASPLARLIENLEPCVVGLDPTMPEYASTLVSGAAFKGGPGGIATWASSVIDVAIWDLYGRILDQPLYRVLGGVREEMTGYALRGLTHRSERELLDELSAVVEEGWQHIKIQLCGIMGDGNPLHVARTMHKLQDHVGLNVRLAIDNQNLWDTHDAIRFGRAIEDLNLFWFEEPVDYRDTMGHAQVAAALDTPVCTGEQRYGVFEFRPLVESHAADVIMVDVRMAGGVTPFRKIAALAEIWNRPITSHMMTAIDMHVLGAAQNIAPVEYVPWSDAIFEQEIRVVAGKLVLPDGPGLGCTLQPGALDRFAA